MYKYVIKCKLTGKSAKETYYYTGEPDSKLMLLSQTEEKATLFFNLADAEHVAKLLLRDGFIDSYVIKGEPAEERFLPSLSYAEMLQENQAVKAPSNKELLAMAIKELDEVIDYLYAENSEQAFRDLCNVVAKLKILQFNMMQFNKKESK